MKTTLKTVVFLMASGSLASAASIIATNLVDVNFTTAGDVALDSSYTAKIGFLDTSISLTSSDNYASIFSNWINAGDITFASGDAAGYDGYFAGIANYTDLAGLGGKVVSIWVTDGANQNIVLTHDNITFLFDDDIPNSTSIGLELATLSEFTIRLGTYNPTSSNEALGGSIAFVPEPSAALLGAIGALGLLRRRRI